MIPEYDPCGTSLCGTDGSWASRQNIVFVKRELTLDYMRSRSCSWASTARVEIVPIIVISCSILPAQDASFTAIKFPIFSYFFQVFFESSPIISLSNVFLCILCYI